MTEKCGTCGHEPRQYSKAEKRKQEILDAAVEIARETGYLKIKRRDIVKYTGVSQGLIRHYYRSMDTLRDAIMGEAVRLQLPDLILQGLAAKDPIAHGAPTDLRTRALAGCA